MTNPIIALMNYVNTHPEYPKYPLLSNKLLRKNIALFIEEQKIDMDYVAKVYQLNIEDMFDPDERDLLSNSFMSRIIFSTEAIPATEYHEAMQEKATF